MVSTYNLILHQGATYRRQFLVNHYILVVESISSSNYIKIAPLAVSIPSGTILKFANGTATTAAIYQPGEEIINVITTSFEIKKCERVAAVPVDFTGYSFDAQIRSDYEAPILNIIDVSNPIMGILQLDIDWHQTALIPSNITSVDLPRNPQHKDQFNLAASNSRPHPYVWQLFGTSGNTRDRLIEGRVLVTPDV
jgi:hypothetical protein